MLEDKLLIWKFKRGSSDALRRIYEKYKNDLLGLTIALLNNRADAEDVVHDVFVSFAEFAGRLELRGSLKSYLSTSIANRVRNLSKTRQRHEVRLDEVGAVGSNSDGPVRSAISAEEAKRIGWALRQLAYEQREVIILHAQQGMKFHTIAEAQKVSVNTAQSRYRYGLSKLRLLLKGKVEK